jgi:hypothetical protein
MNLLFVALIVVVVVETAMLIGVFFKLRNLEDVHYTVLDWVREMQREKDTHKGEGE